MSETGFGNFYDQAREHTLIYANISEAKANLSKLLKYVSQGEEVITGKADQPIARLIPHDSIRGRRYPGILADKGIWVAEDFDETDPDINTQFYDKEK